MAHTEVPWDWDIMPLSKSMVQIFEQCPNRFERAFILKHKMPEVPEALIRGRQFHEEVDKLYDKLKPVREELEAGVREERFLEIYNECLPSDELYWGFREMEWRRYKATEDKRNFFPLHKELFYYDRRRHYYGRVDRVDRLDSGEYAVVDYKTGKYRDWMLSKYRFEMAGYGYLMDQMGVLDGPVTHMAVVFVEPQKVIFERIKDQTRTAFFKKLDRVRSRIRHMHAEGVFDKKIGTLCDWCPYIRGCFSEEKGPT